MNNYTLMLGDCIEQMKTLPAKSVQTCVTSPPYFGLRSYDEASLRIDPSLPEEKRAWLDAELLQRCVHERMGAVYHSDDIPEDLRSYFVRAEIGLEDTPDAFVARLVEVFREVRRVLRDDGTLWLNLGDSYAGSVSNNGGYSEKSTLAGFTSPNTKGRQANEASSARPRMSNVSDLLARDLKGGVLLFGRAHPRCGAAEGVHVLIDDEAAPNGVFQPLLRAQWVTIKQGQDDLCEIGNTFDAPVTCWVRRPLGAALPDDANPERGMYLGENVRVILAAGDLHTDPALRSAVSRAVKNGKATLAVEVAGEPEAESVAGSIAVRDAFAIHTDAVCTPKVDPVDESVALLDGSDRGARRLCDFTVGKATAEHVAFGLHGGCDLRVVSVGHLSLLKNGGVTPYLTLLDKATKKANTLLPKQELGIPEMVKRALMEDGWVCRQTIIWSKPNPMPESVRDRCTKAHEYVFLLSKGPRYYFDSEAIKEPVAESSVARLAQPTLAQQAGSARVPGKTNGNMKAVGNGETRNRRSVWTVTTKPFKGAHFATFPPDLIEPCILAGCPVGGTVLDPFGGSGTTAGVALKHGRNAILCELNPEYACLVPDRVAAISGKRSLPSPATFSWRTEMFSDLLG